MKKISLIISIAALALVAGFYHPQTAYAAGCTVTNAYFDKFTPAGEVSENFFDDADPEEVEIFIKAEGCSAGEQIFVSLVNTAAVDKNVAALDEKGFAVPTSGLLKITMQSGEDYCGSPLSGSDLPAETDCEYILEVGPLADKDAYSSNGKTQGNLNYECDGNCGVLSPTSLSMTFPHPWKYMGNSNQGGAFSTTLSEFYTTYNYTPPTPVVVQAGGATLPGGGTGACAGQANCYEVSSGLGSVLNKFFGKFSVITEATSLGGFLNAIIQIFIGILGLAAVVMIMYEGAKLFIAKKEGQPYSIDNAKSRIGAVLGGFILALLIYPLLRTINPDLLNLTPELGVASLSTALNLSSDPEGLKNVEDLNTSNIQIPTGDYSDITFLMYLYHQQGPGGAPSILWAAKKGMGEIPNKTPFCCKDGPATQVNNNMKNNISQKDWGSITGGGAVTPEKFLLYWRKKVEAAKQKTSPVIPNDIKGALQQVATELNDTNVSVPNLTAMCRIESGCGISGITVVNASGYSGLFQLSEGVFNQYGKGGGILNIYPNIYAGARYGQANLKTHSKNLPKINQ